MPVPRRRQPGEEVFMDALIDGLSRRLVPRGTMRTGREQDEPDVDAVEAYVETGDGARRIAEIDQLSRWSGVGLWAGSAPGTNSGLKSGHLVECLRPRSG